MGVLSSILAMLGLGYGLTKAGEFIFLDPARRETDLALAEIQKKTALESERIYGDVKKSLLKITGAQRREAAAVGLAGTMMGAQAQKEIAKTGAKAQVESARMASQSQNQASLMGLIGSLMQAPSYLATPTQDTAPRLSEFQLPALPHLPLRG